MSVYSNPPDDFNAVALFVDWENMCDGIDTQEGITALRNQAEQFGQLVVARAYADWRDRRYQLSASALYQEGIEPVYVPVDTWDKFNADLKLTSDCIDYAHKHPNVETFVLATGDADFIHVVSTLRLLGKQVVAIAQGEKVAARLTRWVDALIIYDQPPEEPEEPEIPEPLSLITRPANVQPAKMGRNGKLVDRTPRSSRSSRSRYGSDRRSSSNGRRGSNSSSSSRSNSQSSPREEAQKSRFSRVDPPADRALKPSIEDEAFMGVPSELAEKDDKKKSAKKKRKKEKTQKESDKKIDVEFSVQPELVEVEGRWEDIWDMGQDEVRRDEVRPKQADAKSHLTKSLPLETYQVLDAVEEDGVPAEENGELPVDEVLGEIYTWVAGMISNSKDQRLYLGSIKNQLIMQFGHFDQREYGFSTFKAFIEKGVEQAYFATVDEANQQWLVLPEQAKAIQTAAGQTVTGQVSTDQASTGQTSAVTSGSSKVGKNAEVLKQVFQDICTFLRTQDDSRAYLSRIKSTLLEKYGKFSQASYGFKKFSDLMQEGCRQGHFQLDTSGAEMAAIAK